MQRIEGAMVLSGFCDNAFPGSVVVRLNTNADVEILVIAKHFAARPVHHLQIELLGSFLQSTLKGLRIFEAEDIKPTQIRTISDGSLPPFLNPRSCLTGYAVHISQCLKLEAGLVVFVTFKSPELQAECTVLLGRTAVHAYPYLQEGRWLQIYEPQRFRWKSGSTALDSQSVPVTEPIGDETEAQDFFVQDMDQIRLIDAPLPSKHQPPSLALEELHVVDEATSEQHITAEDLVTPLTLLDKEVLAGTEFAYVVGTINLVHPTGWLELREARVYRRNGCHAVSCSSARGNYSGDHDDGITLPGCVVYLSHHLVQHLRVTALGVSVRQGAEVCVARVIPVYLWGRMKGLATTCRSNMHITRFAESKQFVSRDPTYCAVSAKVPAELRNSCTLYTAWRVEITRKLAQAVGGTLLRRNEGLEGRISAAVESNVRLYVDTGANTAASDGAAGDAVVPQSLREVVRVPPTAIQDELFDLNHVFLYTIRNGLDADWLGNSLPQLHTVSHFLVKLQSLHRQRLWLCDEHLFAVAHYDVCAVPRSSSYWSQYSSRGASRRVEKSVTLAGVVCGASWQSGDDTARRHTETVALRVVDAQGASIRVIVRGADEKFKEKLLEACDAVLTRRPTGQSPPECGRCKGQKEVPASNSSGERNRCASSSYGSAPANHSSVSNNRVEYASRCHCSGGSAVSVSDAVVVLIRQPEGLLEHVPAAALRSVPGQVVPEAGHRYYVCCDAVNVTVLCTVSDLNGAQSAAGTASPAEPEPPAAPVLPGEGSDQPLSIRRLLDTDMKGSRQVHLACAVAVVTHVQVLEVEYRQQWGEAEESQHSAAGGKKRRLEPQYSLYADSSRANKANGSSAVEERKCSMLLRDVHYPDSIAMYLPLSALAEVTVGSVVRVNSVYACLPESLKKLYLKPVENKTSIGISTDRPCIASG
jgi:hypothetical protein